MEKFLWTHKDLLDVPMPRTPHEGLERRREDRRQYSRRYRAVEAWPGESDIDRKARRVACEARRKQRNRRTAFPGESEAEHAARRKAIADESFEKRIGHRF